VHVGCEPRMVLEEKAVGRVRIDRDARVREEPSADEQLAKELVERARSEGAQLVGPGARAAAGEASGA
jgi:hypothetical protein